MIDPPLLSTRRDALRAIVATPVVLGAFSAASCGPASTHAASDRVVLYSSADDEILRAIVDRFEKLEHLKVAVVTDTEATKTTGLVRRLLDERGTPRADVWWSSEPLGTVRLGRERVLESMPTSAIPAGRAGRLVGVDRTWAGFAQRARVIAVSTRRVPHDERPTRLRDLIDPRWKGRIGMARPRFGTTRTQMSALFAASNADALRAWLLGLKSNEARLYDGNSSVVRAIAQGEVDVGLTDSDDVWAAKRNGWAVDSVVESADVGLFADAVLPSPGTLLMPNTASLVRAGPNAEGGLKLVRFLLAPDVERALAASDSRNIPVDAGVAGEFPALRVPVPWEPDWERVADASSEAMEICGEVLGG